MGIILIKILQGNAVTQTVLGGLTIKLLVVNFLWYTCTKSGESWLAVDKVIAIIKRMPFLWLTVYICRLQVEYREFLVIISATPGGLSQTISTYYDITFASRVHS